MNPIAERPTWGQSLDEPLWFLLTGEMRHYIDDKQPGREWALNVYSTLRGRQMAEKKMKRSGQDIIFVEWEVTIDQIIKQGRMVFPIASDKILKADKIDILRQLGRH